MRLSTRSVLTGALVLSAAVLEAQQTPQSQFPQQAPPAQKQPAQFPQQSQPPQTQQAAAQTPRQNVAAVVNGDAVTQTEVEVRLQSQIQGQNVDPQTKEKLRQHTLNSLIESRLVEQYVADNGPEVKPTEVETVVSRVKQQLEEQQTDYGQYLASLGHDERAFKKRIKGAIAWRKFQQKELSAENLQKYFQQNRDQFQSVESFEQAQPQVAQAYMATLWEQIISERKPKAKIRIVQPEAPAAPQPGFPGSSPQ